MTSPSWVRAWQAPPWRADVVHGALFDPGAQDLNVDALHQGFLGGFRRQSGPDRELLTSPNLTEASHDGQRWTLQFANGRRLRTRTVVNATGAWADEVAALFGARPIGLVPHRRSAFTFKAPDNVDASGWPAVVGVDESYYFKPVLAFSGWRHKAVMASRVLPVPVRWPMPCSGVCHCRRNWANLALTTGHCRHCDCAYPNDNHAQLTQAPAILGAFI